MLNREWSKAAILELIKEVDFHLQHDERVVFWEEYHHPSLHSKCIRVYTETPSMEAEFSINIESNVFLDDVTSRPKSA
jgi:hypothetical protein